MMTEIVVTRYFLKKIHDKLQEEINNYKYKETYCWYKSEPILLNNNIEETLSFTQEDNTVTVWYEDNFENEYDLDYLKENLKGIIDFDKWKKEEDEDGVIYKLDLNDLVNKKIILDKDKFLTIYMKSNKMCLLKDLDLKSIKVSNFIYLYDDLILNLTSSYNIKYLDDVKRDKNVGEYI